ncbi:MAG: GNAT family N-acetyltransferase [Sporolactobacillus sp.]
MDKWIISEIHTEEKPLIRQLAKQNWGSSRMVVHGDVYDLADQSGFLARNGEKILGMLTWRGAFKQEIELLSLDSFFENRGLGAALLNRLKELAVAKQATRIFLTTTNDNLLALRFYQKRGFTICGLRLNAVNKAREIKPEIPLKNEEGITIEHELDLEYRLSER